MHEVSTLQFWMDRREVTLALWNEVYEWAVANGYTFLYGAAGKATNHPAHSMTWNDAVKWCNARSEREGRMPAYYTSAAKTTVYRTGEVAVQSDWVNWDSGYRLPTEAEWEYACRGWTSTRFSYGDDPGYTNLTNYAWYQANSGSTTHPVGQKLPNPWGLYDMHGNVFEWCQDWYGNYWGGIAIDPQGPVTGGGVRVIRGGCWGNWGSYTRDCRSAYHGGLILDRFVALKSLPPEITRDQEARQRFLLEAKATSALDHSNICTVHDFGETDDGQIYIVMAYYHGETIKNKIEHGPLKIDEAVDIAFAAATRRHGPAVHLVEIRVDGRHWKVDLCGPAGRGYEVQIRVKVDRRSGEVLSYKSKTRHIHKHGRGHDDDRDRDRDDT